MVGTKESFVSIIMQSIKTVGLIEKRQNQAASTLAKTVNSWLQERGISTFYMGKEDELTGNMPECQRNADLVLVLGGDGTMITTAKRLAGKNIPLAGINLGRVGFLLELTADNWREALSNALQHGFSVEKRVTLQCCLERDGEVLSSSIAVNELVISRGGKARLIAMDMAVDGKKLLYLRADGLIASTPTGTTAYASSAGGPLLHPSLNAYSVTPVCPFFSHLKPLVLSCGTILTIQMREIISKAYLTVDSQSFSRLQCGDVIHIQGLPEGMIFANFGTGDYFTKLQSTGIVQDSLGERPYTNVPKQGETIRAW
jgi:NAD+ kinase